MLKEAGGFYGIGNRAHEKKECTVDLFIYLRNVPLKRDKKRRKLLLTRNIARKGSVL